MARGCIRTHSGIKFNLLSPNKEDISLEDIASHLSKMCRYNGATPKLYSVAEHCVRGARWLRDRGESPQVQLAFLLHDAAEAYIKDMPTPLKKEMPGYQKAEEVIADNIMEVFGVLEVWDAYFDVIDHVDHGIMYHWEIRDFWNGPAEWSSEDDKMAYRAVLNGLPTERIKPWSIGKAERQYLKEFWRIQSELAA